MGYKISIISIMLLLSFSLQGYRLFLNQVQPQEQQESYFILDPETLEFFGIRKVSESVDSLLSLSERERFRDARISFHAAREALSLAQEIGYLKGESRAHNLVGIKYLDFGDYALAMNHYLSALSIEEELGNQLGRANMLSNISLIHLEQADYEKAVEYLESSIQVRKELGLQNESYIVFNNLGVIHRRQGEYDKALEYFYEARDLAVIHKDDPDSLLYMIATLNIGNTHRNKKDLDYADEYLYEAEEYFKRHNLKVSQAISNLVLGQLYKDKGDYSKALEHAYSSLDLAETTMQRDRIRDAYELIAELHEDLCNYEQAYFHYRMFHQESDSLLNSQRSERINEMQIRFEVEQKDQEIMLLNRESELQEAQIAQQDQMKRFLYGGLFMLMVIISLLIYMNYVRKNHNRQLRIRRKEIERQNQKLAILNTEKDEFMSIAAHDLRNPLTAIKTAVDLIQTDENLSKDELNDYLKMILISSDRMLSLIGDLLKIQSLHDENGTPVQIVELNVNNPIQQSLINFRQTANNKSIKLHTDLHKGSETIFGNTNNLIRIFDNLISNAIKYSPQGSNIYISTKRSGHSILIAIRDEGPGINSDDKKKLFNKFARLSNQPTGNETSTGLGLYIVKKLVHSMNGRVWCKSKKDNGSIFFIEFPISNATYIEHSMELEDSQ